MNHRTTLTVLVLLTSILTPAVPVRAQLGQRPPVPVKVTLRDDRKLNLEFLGRDKNFVTFHEVGKQMETSLKPSAFKWVDFGITSETNAVNALYQKENYSAVATRLNTLLSPLLPYLDLPSDLPPQVMLLLKCLYRTKRYADVITLSNVISNTLPDEDMRRAAQLYKVLSLLARNERWQANVLLKSSGDVSKTNNLAAMVYYTTAQVQLTYTNWLGAQEASSRVVAFCPRDEDWMAPALFLTAECYAHDKHYDVAEQILKELAIVFSKTQWVEKAKPLQEEYKRLREEQEAAKQNQELPDERGKATIKNLLK